MCGKDQWPLRRAAERFNVSVQTRARWVRRTIGFGKAGMHDRASRVELPAPPCSVDRTSGWVACRLQMVRACTDCLPPASEHLNGSSNPAPLPLPSLALHRPLMWDQDSWGTYPQQCAGEARAYGPR